MAENHSNQRILLQTAVQYYNGGRLLKAESICRQILSIQPNNAGASHLLGVVAHGLGRSQQAIELVRHAIQIDPDRAAYHNSLGAILRDQRRWAEAIGACHEAIHRDSASFEPYVNLGNIFRDTGKLDEAISSFRHAIQLSPNNAMILKNLGGALVEKRQLPDAIAAFSEAIRLKPDYAEAMSDLGNTLREVGQLDEAEHACRRAILINRSFAETFNNLGLVMRAKGEVDEAIAAFRRATELKPAYVEANGNLASTLFISGNIDEAVAVFRNAVRLSPDDSTLHNNLGAALLETRQIDEAIIALQRAVQIKPDYAEAYGNLSGALRQRGQINEAMAAATRAVNLGPEYAEAHWGLALNLLTQGNFAQGWQEYEWRWRRDKFTSPRRNFPQPQWNGCDVHGKTILLHAEQGLGDTLQFVRYAPMVAQRGGRVILECQTPLKRLFSQLPGVDEIITRGELLPPFDLQCPLMSLPLAFKTDMASIPASIPYLKSDPTLSAVWKGRLESEATGRRIGLAWAGSPTQRRDRNRSMKLAQFASLAGLANVAFFSLQKGEAGKQLPPEGLTLRNFTSELNDFADTAALLECLDLIITVDTAVAHLAGAMGKPVWTLLAFSPDWRWLLNRQDSPWYPTMRLFRVRYVNRIFFLP